MVIVVLVLSAGLGHSADCGNGSVSKTLTCQVVVSYYVENYDEVYPQPTYAVPLYYATVDLSGRYINSKKFSTKVLNGEIGFNPLKGGELAISFDKNVLGWGFGYTTKVNFPESCDGEKEQPSVSGPFIVRDGSLMSQYHVEVNCMARTQFSRD